MSFHFPNLRSNCSKHNSICVFSSKLFVFVFVDTPGHGSGWAETPRTDRGGDSIGETPTPGASKRKSRWDETPASQMGGSTPVLTPGKTPIGTPAMNMATPTPGMLVPTICLLVSRNVTHLY